MRACMQEGCRDDRFDFRFRFVGFGVDAGG